MQAPVVVSQVPPQIINEQASYGPLNLNEFIKSAEGDPKPRFEAQIKNGDALPTGMICTGDGQLTGIPAKGTSGLYEIEIIASNPAGSVQLDIFFTIKPSFAGDTADYIGKMKAQVWDALGRNLPIPELDELLDRPVSVLDVYFILERWGVLKIWNALNLDPPGEKTELQLEGASKHYVVYDRGSCIVGAPRDLFSHDRTLEDGLMTARAMAREVYRRGWTIELSGFDKLSRAAWVEVQNLGDEFGKRLEVINYTPSVGDVNIYSVISMEKAIRSGGLEGGG